MNINLLIKYLQELRMKHGPMTDVVYHDYDTVTKTHFAQSRMAPQYIPYTNDDVKQEYKGKVLL